MISWSKEKAPVGKKTGGLKNVVFLFTCPIITRGNLRQVNFLVGEICPKHLGCPQMMIKITLLVESLHIFLPLSGILLEEIYERATRRTLRLFLKFCRPLPPLCQPNDQRPIRFLEHDLYNVLQFPGDPQSTG